jgi:hypothetical protein
MFWFHVLNSPVFAVSESSKEGAKLEYLKFQGCFKHGKGSEAPKDQDRKKSS